MLRLVSLRFERWLKVTPMLLPLLIFWLTGVAGLDYGKHWDEPKLLESVRTSVFEGIYLPTFYNYPSMSHNLGVLAALPEILINIDRNHLNEPVFHEHIAAYQLDNHSLTLRTRLLFLTITSLAIVWVYLLMLMWRKSVWLALLASCIVAFSWEVAYHARWIAPDAILLQFGALWLLCLVNAYRHPEKQYWLWGGVIVAGLATGTKYPAGLLLFPMLGLIYAQIKSRQLVIMAIVVFGITYLMTTPGTLLQPFKFWHEVEFEMWHYSFGHSKQTVSAGLEHLIKNLEYLGTVQLSHFSMIAILLFGFVIIGVWGLWRESRRLAGLLLMFPLMYLLFMSLQRAMLIRNLLILVPFMAILISMGVLYVWRLMRSRWLRIMLGVMIGLMLSINGGWLVYSAQSIANRRTDRHNHDMRAWIEQSPDVRFYATSSVMLQLGDDPPLNVTSDLSAADEVFVYLTEIQEVEPMRSNIPRLFVQQFGSWEVNIEYYTWHGDDRIVLLPIETVQTMGLESYLH